MAVRLGSRERTIIVVAILVSAISLVIGIKYFSSAFPEASLTLRINRADSLPIAEKFLSSRGFSTGGYRHAAIFTYDDDAKTYLERTQGLAEMNQLTRGPIHLWRWSHRWFKPQQKEEFRVEVDTQGRVVGFDHEIPDAARGASLTSDQARQIAQQFLQNTIHRELSGLEFLDVQSERRPARVDYSFTWNQKNVNLGKGSYRIEVDVAGDQVAGYSEYVKIPDQYLRDYQSLRSRNTSAQLVDQVFWILLSLAMLVILVKRLRDHDVPLKMAAGFGLVGTALYFLEQLNSFSLSQFGYSTTDSYSSFMTGYFRDAVLSALGVGALIFLLVASAEPVYRENLPRLGSLRRTLSWRGLRSRSFFIANVVGIAMTFFFFAYQTVFYLAADKLGAWAPADIPFSNLLNTRIPWAAVLLMGFLPAMSEELQFRAFGVPFLAKLFRSRAAGLILAAFIWGFLHSAYPNQPFFIRGVEVGVAGIIVGVIMLHFGIFATLIWHYSVDALYTAFLLLRSPNNYLRVSGGLTAGIMLIPLIVALIAYLRRGTFSEESDLTNERAGIRRAAKEELAAEAETSVSYQPLKRPRIVAAGVLFVILVGAAFIPAYRFGRDITLNFARSAVTKSATAYLAKKGVKVGEYRRAAWLVENIDPLTLRYFLERLSIKESEQLYRRSTRMVLWEVRFFKPMQKEEYRVFVDPGDNRVFGDRHVLDENAPGATPSPDAARALAENFLRQQGYQLSDFELQNSDSKKREAREDYTLTWQVKPDNPLNVGEAHFRIAVDVAGDQVVGTSRYFKLPEEWTRQREASRLENSILLGLESLLGIALFALMIMLFVRRVRAGKIPWRRSLWTGVALAGLTIVGELNAIPLIYQRYITSISLGNFWITVAVGLAVAPLLMGLVVWLAVALATSLYPDSWAIFRSAARRVWRRDAVIAIALSLAAAAGLTQLNGLISNRFHRFAPVSFDIFSGQMDVSFPVISVMLHAIVYTVLIAALAAILIYLARSGWLRRAWWIWPLVLLILISLGPSGAHSGRQYIAGWAMAFIPLIGAVVIAGWFCRTNILAYVAAIFCLQIAAPLEQLLSQPSAFFRWNGIVVLLLSLLLLAWMLAIGSRAKQSV
ncbi:MAG TPA: CPBP family intramembrane glutamic endopeptidase [Terriglobia bacterium]|nr:CPBP family intramembrane glutamic endopeptidase [Terriglobia bacterium]